MTLTGIAVCLGLIFLAASLGFIIGALLAAGRFGEEYEQGYRDAQFDITHTEGRSHVHHTTYS